MEYVIGLGAVFLALCYVYNRLSVTNNPEAAEIADRESKSLTETNSYEI
jgi:hypothetical protein